MLLYIYKMGVHWYFRFAVKTADNRDKMLKYGFSTDHGDVVFLENKIINSNCNNNPAC